LFPSLFPIFLPISSRMSRHVQLLSISTIVLTFCAFLKCHSPILTPSLLRIKCGRVALFVDPHLNPHWRVALFLQSSSFQRLWWREKISPNISTSPQNILIREDNPVKECY
jgi:hypothetical protein